MNLVSRGGLVGLVGRDQRGFAVREQDEPRALLPEGQVRREVIHVWRVPDHDRVEPSVLQHLQQSSLPPPRLSRIQHQGLQTIPGKRLTTVGTETTEEITGKDR